MTTTSNNYAQEIIQIKQLIDKCHFDKVLQKVDLLVHQKNLPANIRLQYKLLKANILNKQNKFNEGLHLTEKIYEDIQKQENPVLLLDLLITKAESLAQLDRHEEGLDVIAQAENKLPTLKPDHRSEIQWRQATLLLHKGYIFKRKSENDRAQEYLQQGLALCKQFDKKYLTAEILHELGVTYHFKVDFEKAIEYYKQSLELCEELGYKQGMIKSLLQISWLYSNGGDWKSGLEYGHQALALAEEINNPFLIAYNLYAISFPYKSKGDFKQALGYIQQSLPLAKELGVKDLIAWNLWGLGHIYSETGDLDLGLEYLQQSVDLSEELGFKHLMGMAFETTGVIYRQKGDWEQALAYLKKSLALFEESDTLFFIARSLYQLIQVTIDTSSLDLANHYLKRFQLLNQRVDNKVIDHQCRVAEALILKTSPRTRHRGKAEEMLEQIVGEEISFHPVTIVALLHLCDLLLAELNATEDPKLLNAVQGYVSQLLDIASQQGSNWLLAETYVLQSRLALVNLNLQGARKFLQQAQQIADEHGLHRLAMQISTEHDTLLDQLSQWEDLIKRNASISERTELAQLTDLLVRMVHKHVDDLPEVAVEDPELLLIIGAESGLSVFSKIFRTDQPLEEHLIAGFLTAINAFVQDAFASSGSIERIKHQEHTLLLQPMDPFLICYVFQGPSYNASQKFGQFIDTLQSSPTILDILTEAFHNRRFLSKEEHIETLVSEIFLTSVT